MPVTNPKIPPWSSFQITIDTSFQQINLNSTSDFNIVNFYTVLLQKYANSVHYYTDGSKTTTGTGCSILCNNFTTRFSLPNLFSVLSSELYALLLATYDSISNQHTRAVFFTDSLSAIQSIQNFTNRSQHPIARSIAEAVYRNQQISITFCWIPSHRGIYQNEQADIAARESTLMFPLPQLSSAKIDARNQLHSHFNSVWHQRWTQLHTDNKLRALYPTVPTPLPLDLPRKTQVLLTRLRLGHTKITHSYLMDKTPPSLCPCSNTPISVKHFLTDCPSLQVLRTQFFSTNYLPDLLSSDYTSISQLIRFLAKINVLTRI